MMISFAKKVGRKWVESCSPSFPYFIQTWAQPPPFFLLLNWAWAPPLFLHWAWAGSSLAEARFLSLLFSFSIFFLFFSVWAGPVSLCFVSLLSFFFLVGLTRLSFSPFSLVLACKPGPKLLFFRRIGLVLLLLVFFWAGLGCFELHPFFFNSLLFACGLVWEPHLAILFH